MSAIGPGTVVVKVSYTCPHCRQDASAGSSSVKTGGIYRVDRVTADPGYCDDVWLVGHPSSPECLRGLRPLNSGEEYPEIAERIKRAKPVREPVA